MTHATRDNDAGVTRIRLIRRIILDGGPKSVGSEHVVDWSTGRRLIGDGAAEPCDPDRFGRPTRYTGEGGPNA